MPHQWKWVLNPIQSLKTLFLILRWDLRLNLIPYMLHIQQISKWRGYGHLNNSNLEKWHLMTALCVGSVESFTCKSIAVHSCIMVIRCHFSKLTMSQSHIHSFTILHSLAAYRVSNEIWDPSAWIQGYEYMLSLIVLDLELVFTGEAKLFLSEWLGSIHKILFLKHFSKISQAISCSYNIRKKYKTNTAHWEAARLFYKDWTIILWK